MSEKSSEKSSESNKSRDESLQEVEDRIYKMISDYSNLNMMIAIGSLVLFNKYKDEKDMEKFYKLKFSIENMMKQTKEFDKHYEDFGYIMDEKKEKGNQK